MAFHFSQHKNIAWPVEEPLQFLYPPEVFEVTASFRDYVPEWQQVANLEESLC
jgi:hypothetical protein